MGRRPADPLTAAGDDGDPALQAVDRPAIRV